MTDFDTKLAELEANSDRVPELKMVVELLRMLKDQHVEATVACMDPTHQYAHMRENNHVTCSTCGRPKMPKF